MKVLVLGGTGMLGSMVARVLPADYQVVVTTRGRDYPYDLENHRWDHFAVDGTGWQERLKVLADGCDWIVNCLGATKPLMQEDHSVTVNTVLPQMLDSLGPPVIHPSTDCVFAPRFEDPSELAPRTEISMPDATDGYGLSKAEGERGLRNTMILRSSLIGPELRPARYLLGLVVEGQVHQGYAHHIWNGVTTLAWARIVGAYMESPMLPSHLQHVVPVGTCSKDRLASTILQAFNIQDIALHAYVGRQPSVLVLSSDNLTAADFLWRQAGYDDPPTIEEMVHELAEFCRTELWPPGGCEGWRYWRR